jgi:hypothetical protein
MLLVIRRARRLAALRVKDCDNSMGKARMVAVSFHSVAGTPTTWDGKRQSTSASIKDYSPLASLADSGHFAQPWLLQQSYALSEHDPSLRVSL